MTDEEFDLYMENLDRYTEMKRNNLCGLKMPELTSVEEIKQYYDAITLDEYERKLSAMY